MKFPRPSIALKGINPVTQNWAEMVRINENGHLLSARNLLIKLAPQVRLELTTLRLTAECSAIELLRKSRNRLLGGTLKIIISHI